MEEQSKNNNVDSDVHVIRDRTRFTMDEGLSDAVLEQFVNLYNKGLIYKGTRMINWCPSCHT